MEEFVTNKDYEGLASLCELEELQSEGGVVNPDIYAHLLAVYLLQNELDHAKLLWQRIPDDVKVSCPVLGQLWDIGKHLWRKDFPAVYKQVRSVTWPSMLAPLVAALVVFGYIPANSEWLNSFISEKLQERVLCLVGKAYRTIHVTDLCALLGLTEEEVRQVATEKGWTFDATSNTYLPSPLTSGMVVTEAKEERLQKLTDIISFLEN